MLIAFIRQLAVATSLILFVYVSVVVWPVDDFQPSQRLSAAGARLCYVNDDMVLEGVTLEGDHVDDEMVDVAAQISTLARLSLAGSNVTSRGIRSLRSLPNLSSLNLSHTRLTADAFREIAQFPALKELRLDDCEWVNDDCLKELASIRHVELLSLAGTEVTGEGLVHLRELHNLRVLILEGCSKVDDTSVERLCQLCEGRRTALNISATNVSRAGLGQLRQALPANVIAARPETMAEFRAVEDRGQFFTNPQGDILGFRRRMDSNGHVIPLRSGDLALLKNAPEMVELNLEDSNVDDSMLLELPHLPHLESLLLSSTLVTDESLTVLERFPCLKSLHLMDNSIEGPGLANLHLLPQLSHLKVQAQHAEEILASLQYLSELTTLTIHAPLTDDDMTQFTRIPKLEFLALVRTKVRATGIARLAECSALTELRFEDGMLDDSDVPAIARLTSIKRMSFINTQLTRVGRNRLAKLCPRTSIEWPEQVTIGALRR